MSKQVVYCYPALLKPKENGYDVEFVDFDCKSEGENQTAAIENGREALALHIDEMLKNKIDVPAPSAIENIDSVGKGVLVMIDFNINLYRFKNKHKSVTRAVTLPQSLNERAKASDINVSALLQEALKEKLGIKED